MKEALKDSFISAFPFIAAFLLGSLLLFSKLYFSPIEDNYYQVTTELYYSSLLKNGLLYVSLKDPEARINALQKELKRIPKQKLILTTEHGKRIPYSLISLPLNEEDYTYNNMYKISAKHLKRHKVIIARLQIEDSLSAKNTIQVPQNKNRTGLQNLMDAVNIVAMLGEATKTLKYAQILIKHFPDSPSGYFYQGVGYEFENKNELASNSYREALARTKTPTGEMPAYLMFKRFTVLEGS